MIKVYHQKEPTSLAGHEIAFTRDVHKQSALVAALFAADGYELVATIESSNLEHAWEVTNNIETPWSLQPAEGVTPVLKQPQHGRRSSMMGDIFENDGVKSVVAWMGFTRLPRIEGAAQ